MNLFAEILSKFSNAELSVALGIDESHARVIKVRGLIPVEHWPAIIVAAQAKGFEIDFASLVEARQARSAAIAARRAGKAAA